MGFFLRKHLLESLAHYSRTARSCMDGDMSQFNDQGRRAALSLANFERALARHGLQP